LENRRKNARLAVFYKGLHGLSAIPCDSLCRPVRIPDTLTRTHSLLVLIAISTRSSIEVRTISEWNKLSQDVRSKPSVVSFRSTLLKLLDQSKIIPEP